MQKQKMWRRALASVMASAMALTCAGTGLTAFAADGGTSFLDQLQASYGEPDQHNMTEVRWWLPEGGHTDQTIIEEINNLHAQGFTGIELCLLDEAGMDADVYGYGSEPWAHDVTVAIETAADLDMRVGITSGTHWRSANIPGLDPNSEAAGQEIGISIENVAAGQKNAGTLTLPPVRRGVDTNDVKKTFVGAYAYRVGSNGNGNQTVLDTTVGPIDLTDQVVQVDDQTWTLDWTAPDDGDYVLYAMWQQGTFQVQQPSQEDAYSINYYNEAGVEALKEYLSSYYFSDEELVEAIRSADIQFFMDSLEIETSQGQRSLYWSKDMRQDFIDKKGYDIVPYLPLFYGISSGTCFTGAGHADGVDGIRTGNVVLSAEDGQTVDSLSTWKILNDLYDVQTQLIKEELMDPLREWAKENYNMHLRSQMPYGTYMETSEMGMGMDYVETESLNMKDQTDTYRLWSGAAHILNTMYSSETACVTGANYSLTEQDYIKIANLQFAGGINRTIWHGHASSWGPENNTQWPGFEGMRIGLSTRLDNREPNSKDYIEMNSYFGRVQQLLREGVSRTDLGILHLNYGENTEWPTTYADWIGNHQGIYWTDMSLQNAGYTYDYFSPDYLNLMDYDAESGTLGDTVGYQAILLQQQRMPVDAAKRLLELAKQGLKVIIVDDAATITPYHNESDADLKAVMDEIKALDNVAVVATEADAYDALLAMDVRPRAELADTEQILTQVREDEEENLYLYAYNYCDDQHKFLQYKTTNPESHGTIANTDVSVDGLYIPYAIDPWTGEVQKVANYRYEDGRTILNLTLEYNDVALFAFEPAAEEELHAVASEADVINNDGDFTVRATETGSYTTTLSDGATYVTTVDVPAAAELTGWDLSVENWTAGDPEKRSETRRTTVYDAETGTFEEVDLTTEEVRYATNKDLINTHLDELATWDNIEEIGRDVSGIGYYTTTFTWDADRADGAYLDLGSFNQNAVVEVNGQRADVVDVVDAVIDISDLLKDGENTLKITVTSTLVNRLLSLGIVPEGTNTYDGVDKLTGFNGYRCTYQSNGLSSVTLIPYVEETLNEEALTPVISATAPKTAQVNEDFVVSVVVDSSISDVKLFNENGLALGRKNIEVTDNQDGTKTFNLTVSVGTVGNGRTFKVVTLGKEGYLIDSGVSVSLDITSVPSSLSAFDLPDEAVANRTFIVTAATDLSATKIEVYNENGMKMGIKSLTSKVVDGQKVWTGVMSIGTPGERSFSCYAVNKYGDRSEPLSDSLSVKAFA